MLIQEPIQAAIWHCLNHYDHKDAVFLAERLCSEVESDETIFLLATSYYRSNLMHQAYWLLKEKARRSSQCRFLQAKCAYELKKYSDAECVLMTNGFGDSKHFDEVVRDFGEIACFVFQLIAQICLKTERSKMAANALRRALKLNPFLWNAFTDLCLLGQEADAANIFQISNTDIFNTCQGNANTNSMILFGNPNNINDSGTLSQQSLLNYGAQNALETLLNNISSSNNSSYVLSTPVVDQQHQHLQNNGSTMPVTPQNMITPNNNNNNINNNNSTNNNLNSSISMLRGGAGGVLGVSTTGYNATALTQQHNNSQNSSMMMIMDDTPIGGYVHDTSNCSNIGGGGGGCVSSNVTETQSTVDGGAGTPFRKQFKYLSAVSPTTPSFGIMPLYSPCTTFDSPFISSNGSGSQMVGGIQHQHHIGNNLNITNSPLPQMLVEVNQEPKILGKKLKSHVGVGVGSLINRKDTSTITNTITNTNKPAVFSQTGNITPRTPNNTGNNVTVVAGAALPNAALRRSSRLFSNSAYSVKENNKSPNITSNKFVQPRSPPRKTKSRMNKIFLNNELIEDKTHNIADKFHNEKQARKAAAAMVAAGEKEKIETITSASCNNRSATEEAKVLLNNSLNNAQTLTHQLMSMKKQSADGLMALLRNLAEGYKLLSNYQCKTAIKHLESTIPKHHLCSSWVQSLIGVCNYELREYEAAVAIFKRIHETEPCRLDFMEIYSSSLWHLQKEVELSALAQDLINQSKISPVTWCVAGNCFSLHKEHETAIKFFKRAVQVDSDFVYSYTLLGHELVLTEEFDKAMEFFRAAVVRDPRHYNAWFGIGTIYSKQEKYELAELHYVKALKINPHNSVILVHVGAMQSYMQKKDLALQTLNTAATLNPTNPLARFHRGSIYFSLGKYTEALKELEELKEIVPKESVVFYLIGKIHKRLGNIDLALMHFSWATDLDPKGANNQIKDAFDSMAHPSLCHPNEATIDVDLEPTSDRSDDSTQAQQDVNYESDY